MARRSYELIALAIRNIKKQQQQQQEQQNTRTDQKKKQSRKISGMKFCNFFPPCHWIFYDEMWTVLQFTVWCLCLIREQIDTIDINIRYSNWFYCRTILWCYFSKPSVEWKKNYSSLLDMYMFGCCCMSKNGQSLNKRRRKKMNYSYS